MELFDNLIKNLETLHMGYDYTICVPMCYCPENVDEFDPVKISDNAIYLNHVIAGVERKLLFSNMINDMYILPDNQKLNIRFSQ